MLKKKYIVIKLFLLFSCSPKFIPSESITAKNTSNIEVQVNVTTLEKTQVVGANKALRKTFERLFFIGFPNTISSTPLIINNSNSQRNEQFLNDFLEGKKYDPFISSISHNTQKVKNPNGYALTDSKIIIDIASLRRHLEATGQTRKFGY